MDAQLGAPKAPRGISDKAFEPLKKFGQALLTIVDTRKRFFEVAATFYVIVIVFRDRVLVRK
jgi:hypothetical protein